jgi:flavin reductase (DIM6/NTAB) family NADH-FMN oxidoreductase RutF
MPMSAAAVFERTDRELWIVTARAGERTGGLVATFVNQASIVPELPRVLVGLARRHYTTQLVEASGAFALHLIGERQLEWVWRFGLASGRAVDKLDGLAWHAGATGSPLLDDAVAWLDCRVEAKLDTGDRIVCLAEVVSAGLQSTASPLTMKQLLQQAPRDKLVALKEQLQRDAQIDAEAIRAWRAASNMDKSSP